MDHQGLSKWAGGRLWLVRDRQIHHAERQFGYKVYLVSYEGEWEGGGEKGEKEREAEMEGRK